VPPEEEQRQLTRILGDTDEQIDSAAAYVDKLRRIKAGLMHDLLTGRVRVPVPGASTQKAAANV
jgi:type I restriction enzyme S subunit